MDIKKCKCGKIAIALVEYDDGEVEPVCDECSQAKKEWVKEQEGAVMSRKIPKSLKANFNDLFDSKEAAVICYLSLERRYIRLNKEFNDFKRNLKDEKERCFSTI